MLENSRIGLVLLRSSWTGCGVPEELAGQVESHGQAIVERLDQRYDIHGPYVVSTLDSVRDCIRALNDTDLDLIVLAFQTWVEDDTLQALLKMPCACPIVVWNVLPWRRMPRPVPFTGVLRSTGAVSAFGALGSLRDQDIPFLFTWGAVDDPRLLRDLDVAARAAQLRGSLRRARFGLLPPHQPIPRPLQVEESRLLADMGPYVDHISLESYRHAVDDVPRSEIDAYLADLRAQVVIEGVAGETLEQAARQTLAMKAIAEARRLDLLALDYAAVELQDEYSNRPGLYPFLGAPEDRPVEAPLIQPEPDLGAATANYVLSRLTGAPAMFLEFWYWDEALNQIVGGHGGPQDLALGAQGQVLITRDFHACLDENIHGAQVQMIARSGRVTIFQMRAAADGWQAVAASGMVLESRPVVEGYPHALLRLDAQIDHFLNRLARVGATQHWLMGYGSVLHELETFCQMNHIPLEILTS